MQYISFVQLLGGRDQRLKLNIRHTTEEKYEKVGERGRGTRGIWYKYSNSFLLNNNKSTVNVKRFSALELNFFLNHLLYKHIYFSSLSLVKHCWVWTSECQQHLAQCYDVIITIGDISTSTRIIQTILSLHHPTFWEVSNCLPTSLDHQQPRIFSSKWT